MLEYRVIVLRAGRMELDEQAERREAQLNEAAAEGWRVVGVDVGQGLLLLERGGEVVVPAEVLKGLLEQGFEPEAGEGHDEDA